MYLQYVDIYSKYMNRYIYKAVGGISRQGNISAVVVIYNLDVFIYHNHPIYLQSSKRKKQGGRYICSSGNI